MTELLPWIMIAWVVGAWLTHVVTCIKTASWVFLLAGEIGRAHVLNSSHMSESRMPSSA